MKPISILLAALASLELAGAACGTEAADSPTSGTVMLHCMIAKSGVIERCQSTFEQPVGLGLGDLAKPLVEGKKITPVSIANDGMNRPSPLDFAADFPVCFNLTPPPVRASLVSAENCRGMTAEGPVYTDRDVAGVLTIGVPNNVFPSRALDAGFGGVAQVHCSVSETGDLSKCAVDLESPRNEGFGTAVLKLTPRIKIQPLLVDGKPAAGTAMLSIQMKPIMSEGGSPQAEILKGNILP